MWMISNWAMADSSRCDSATLGSVVAEMDPHRNDVLDNCNRSHRTHPSNMELVAAVD